MTVHAQLLLAQRHKTALALATNEEKNNALCLMAKSLQENFETILKENEKDLQNASHISDVMLDRLRLTKARIFAMADAILALTALPDPVGRVLERIQRPNGLAIDKVSVPLGVLAMIYESRPNVTSDAAALALKSGNVCILRGGKEAIFSNIAIVAALQQGLSKSTLPADCLQLITDTSRSSATELMHAVGLVDMLIPRGGAGLIRACVENAKVPVIETGTGICHLFADESLDIEMALSIIENAKTSRPSVCNAAEVLLVHEGIAPTLLPLVKKRLVNDRIRKGLCPVELRLDEAALNIIEGTPASENDFDTEFLDYILAVKVVANVHEAITHISTHSTHHSECILTQNDKNAELFTKMVDSAAVYVNASTRFTDGGEFGLGCEMGISTGKLHARGPMGLCEMNTYKYIIKGNGQTR
jgi:glutamate-5-semialdehyde dehydrogenase